MPSSPTGRHSKIAAQAPLLIGLVAVTFVFGTIVVAGEAMLPETLLDNIGQQQANDLDRFRSVLHLGGLNLQGDGATARLDAVAGTVEFDSLARRAMFGIDATRLDLYTLNGTPLYTANERLIHLGGEALDTFRDARRGLPSSRFIPAETARAEFGIDADLLQTYRLIFDVPPRSATTGHSLMVAAVASDVTRDLAQIHRTIWWIAGVFAAGMLFIMLVLQWASDRSRTRLEAANELLASQYDAVRESRERMINASNAAKRAIAEELHGHVQSKLFALWMRLSRYRESAPGTDRESGRELDEIIEELDLIREEDIRGLSHRLHPSIVRVGAGPALRSLRSFYEPMFPIELEIGKKAEELEPPGISAIPENVRLGVYRIAELALANVFKHAKASTCRLRWDYESEAGSLLLSVEDDGVGFDCSRSEGSGIGLVTMNDYADSLQATISVESSPGRGTKLSLSVPFQVGHGTAAPAEKGRQAFSGAAIQSGSAGEQRQARAA